MDFRILSISILSAALLNSCTGSDQVNTKENYLLVDVVDSEKESKYLAFGENIVIETQLLMTQNLINTIEKKGSEFALDYCNPKSIPMTDGMSYHITAGIKRVTDKPRNSENHASKIESGYIKDLRNELAAGKALLPIISERKNTMAAYYPVLANVLCLKCHGKKDLDVNAGTFLALKKNYPADKAMGYRENELMGLWVVEMAKDIY